mgnify:CR=1 FL=1
MGDNYDQGFIMVKSCTQWVYRAFDYGFMCKGRIVVNENGLRVCEKCGAIYGAVSA